MMLLLFQAAMTEGLARPWTTSPRRCAIRGIKLLFLTAAQLRTRRYWPWRRLACITTRPRARHAWAEVETGEALRRTTTHHGYGAGAINPHGSRR
jgi:hypothetical protein